MPPCRRCWPSGDPDPRQELEAPPSLRAGRRRALGQPVLLDGDPVLVAELAEHRVFRPAAERNYTVRRTGEASFAVTGAGIERLVARYDLDNEEALAHLERRLRGHLHDAAQTTGARRRRHRALKFQCQSRHRRGGSSKCAGATRCGDSGM